MKQMTSGLVAAMVMAVAGAGWAQAQAITSVYSRIDAHCREHALEDEPVVLIRCNAPDAWQIEIQASEHGASITYTYDQGPVSPALHTPARGLFGRFHDVIEWREVLGVPFASIHRYFDETPGMMSGGEDESYQTLMVTALRPETPDTACVVAYIDASGLPDANTLARDAADRLARGWDCALDPIWFDADMPSVDAYIARLGHH
jgi:hypothetical protein